MARSSPTTLQFISSESTGFASGGTNYDRRNRLPSGASQIVWYHPALVQGALVPVAVALGLFGGRFTL
jgi:hypothetical protein